CTPDHLFLVNRDNNLYWIMAQHIRLNKDKLVLGFEGVLDEPSADEVGYQINNMSMDTERDRVLAYARLLGLSYYEDIPKLLKSNCRYATAVATDAFLFNHDFPSRSNQDWPEFILD